MYRDHVVNHQQQYEEQHEERLRVQRKIEKKKRRKDKKKEKKRRAREPLTTKPLEQELVPSVIAKNVNNGSDSGNSNNSSQKKSFFVNTTTFYSAWRNRDTRSLIRALLKDREIRVDFDSLTNNHKFLSLLSPALKRSYGISIRLDIRDTDQLVEYYNHPYKYLINHLVISIEQREEEVVDCDLFGVDIDVLEIEGDKDTVCVGTLAASIGRLKLRVWDHHREVDVMVESYSSSHSLLDWALGNLPNNLLYLHLDIPDHVHIQTPVVLPVTLRDLDFVSTQRNLQQLLVDPTKQFDHCALLVQSEDDLRWLRDRTWIKGIKARGFVAQNYIPRHVTRLEMFYPLPIEADATIDQDLDYLSPSLTSFRVNQLRGIAMGALPHSLRVLEIGSLAQPLCAGVLPASLNKLALGYYHHPLMPGVLPCALQTLDLKHYNSAIEPASLPQSLTRLSLGSYNGAFDSFGVLDHLIDLLVHNLHPSIHTLISPHTKYLRLSYCHQPSPISLATTAIENLLFERYKDNTLDRTEPDIIDLHKFLPATLHRLETKGPLKLTNFPSVSLYIHQSNKNVIYK
ncbi:hypothetical protein CYY_000240 [Polysphondylium violaceum]|uniref:Uncharacterized protein n=1 Tax=Polysphondylium violaceum TaxID=133409 RepID=A0A8J4Q489_9MYCE|nr:hypothetical protein CYY_000240 [Polysphondylium violaceum]